MSWNIIGDSSCDLFDLEKNIDGVSYRSVPFFINVEDKEYIDDDALDIGAMMDHMEKSKKASSTACPSPQSWTDKMTAGENNICVTVSKNLSGSYQSADIATKAFEDENENTKAAVVDGCATGPSSVLTVRKLTELIEKGESFENVIEKTREYVGGIHTVFALSCFDNLVKSGRVGKIAGFLASSLDFRGVGVESGGRIAFKTKVRGKKKVISAMLEIIKENGFNGGDVVISHCFNEELALTMKKEIEALDEKVNVTIMPTRGLNSFYADNAGLIISY